MKDRVNAISLAPLEEFRRDSDLFGAGMRLPETQDLQPAMVRGLQTRDGELHLATMLNHLSDGAPDHGRATEVSAAGCHGGAVMCSAAGSLHAVSETIGIDVVLGHEPTHAVVAEQAVSSPQRR